MTITTLRVFLALLFTALPGAINNAAAQKNSLLIRNVTIVSPEQANPRMRQDVLVENGRITKIGQRLEVKAETQIDGSGQFLTPGLIDSHTHLAGVPGMSYRQQRDHKDVADAAKAQIPRSYLFHGFTSVIDLHSSAQRIAQWNGQNIRPTAYFCGGAPLIEGYPMSFIPKAFRYQSTPYLIVEDGFKTDAIDVKRHSPRAVVNRMKEDGAICVKTHYEPGFGAKRDLPTPSTALIRELKLQAHQQGLKVLLHANSQSAQEFGLDVGVDAFAHGLWTWDKQTPTTLSADIMSLLDQAMEQGVLLQPTVQVLYGERDLHQPDYLQHRAMLQVLPESLIQWYASKEGQSFRVKMSQIPYVQRLLRDNNWRKINAAPIARLNATLGYWLENGGQLLFGSDTPSDMTYANPPGLNGWFEMQRWQQAGVSPTQFLAAATINNAAFFNLANEVGSIERGKRADMLLLSEDPSQSIDAFDAIELVIINGVPIERNSLSAN